jgi:hypothetical protein
MKPHSDGFNDEAVYSAFTLTGLWSIYFSYGQGWDQKYVRESCDRGKAES